MFHRFTMVSALFCAIASSTSPCLQAQSPAVKNIVLVQGAWVDGSGWKLSMTSWFETDIGYPSFKNRLLRSTAT
jgi:hypothetical protein